MRADERARVSAQPRRGVRPRRAIAPRPLAERRIRAGTAAPDGGHHLLDARGLLHRWSGNVEATPRILTSTSPLGPVERAAMVASEPGEPFEVFVVTSSDTRGGSKRRFARFDGQRWTRLDQAVHRGIYLPDVARAGPGRALAIGTSTRSVAAVSLYEAGVVRGVVLPDPGYEAGESAPTAALWHPKLGYVLVGEDGSVENRLIDLVPEMPTSALSEAANFLNSHMRGRTLSEARHAMQARHQDYERELDELTKRVVDTGLATWAGAEAGRPRQLIVRGRANLLEDLKAVEDLERIRVLFDDLERNRDLVQLLGNAETGDGVRIFIGTENKLFSLSGSSLVVSPFRDKDQRVIGILGVIGPTRLNYARVIPMVDYTAKVVSKILG